MSKQTEAERLADALERQFPTGTAQGHLDGEAAAELRRLVSFNNDLMDEVARLKQAEQPEPLPVKTYSGGKAWHVAPTQREWVGLYWDELPDTEFGNTAFLLGAKWAEAKLKEKNT